MFKYIPIKEQVRSLQKENIVLKEQATKSNAMLEYIAICDYPEILDEEEEVEE